MKNRFEFIELDQSTRQRGLTTVVPFNYLHGRQTPDEYSYNKTRRVKRGFREEGPHYLYNHPIDAVYVPINETQARIINYDGHHRHRFAPEQQISGYGTVLIPCVLYTLGTILAVLKQHPDNQKLNEDVLADILLAQAANEAQGFQLRMGHEYQHPQPLDASSIEDIYSIAAQGLLGFKLF